MIPGTKLIVSHWYSCIVPLPYWNCHHLLHVSRHAKETAFHCRRLWYLTAAAQAHTCSCCVPRNLLFSSGANQKAVLTWTLRLAHLPVRRSDFLNISECVLINLKHIKITLGVERKSNFKKSFPVPLGIDEKKLNHLLTRANKFILLALVMQSCLFWRIFQFTWTLSNLNIWEGKLWDLTVVQLI